MNCRKSLYGRVLSRSRPSLAARAAAPGLAQLVTKPVATATSIRSGQPAGGGRREQEADVPRHRLGRERQDRPQAREPGAARQRRPPLRRRSRAATRVIDAIAVDLEGQPDPLAREEEDASARSSRTRPSSPAPSTRSSSGRASSGSTGSGRRPARAARRRPARRRRRSRSSTPASTRAAPPTSAPASARRSTSSRGSSPDAHGHGTLVAGVAAGSSSTPIRAPRRTPTSSRSASSRTTAPRARAT